MRRLIAALACRLAGSRLYGKPLQNLDPAQGVSILDHQIGMLSRIAAIDEIVLGIAEGAGNVPLVQYAEKNSVRYILGSEEDVLARLIQCTEAGDGTDAFRITTESPFTHWEMIDEAWSRHVTESADVTVVEGVPLGSSFEIYALAALQKSHDLGDCRHRSELCSLYIREHRDEFSVCLIDAEPEVARNEFRFTVDYPEDLVLCRAIYDAMSEQAPLILLRDIVAFLDDNPELTGIVSHLPSGGYWG